MIVKIRLARFGRTNRPYFWLVVSGKGKRDSGFKHKLGRYDPLLATDKLIISDEQLFSKYIKCGAQVSDTIVRLVKANAQYAPLLNKEHTPAQSS